MTVSTRCVRRGQILSIMRASALVRWTVPLFHSGAGVIFGISRVRLTQDNRHTLREAPPTIYLDDLIAVSQVGTYGVSV